MRLYSSSGGDEKDGGVELQRRRQRMIKNGDSEEDGTVELWRILAWPLLQRVLARETAGGYYHIMFALLLERSRGGLEARRSDLGLGLGPAGALAGGTTHE